MSVIRIVLVDDHRVVARSLQSYLESFPDIQVVGIAASGEELLANLSKETSCDRVSRPFQQAAAPEAQCRPAKGSPETSCDRVSRSFQQAAAPEAQCRPAKGFAWNPDIVIQDLLLPGGIDGIETTRRVRELAPNVRVIALTASMDEARMTAVLRAGAAGYVRKDADPEILLAAIRAVARGKIFLDPSVTGRVLPGADDLTRRELEVLRLLAAGRSNKEIANTLAIGDETVKTHVTNVLGKLQAENRAQAVAFALKRGLVNLEEIA